MPLYEFHCDTHGRFEKLCKLSAKKSACPTCKIRCSKVVSKSNFTVGTKIRVPKVIDKAVGEASHKAWEKHYERKTKREKEKSRKA